MFDTSNDLDVERNKEGRSVSAFTTTTSELFDKSFKFHSASDLNKFYFNLSGIIEDGDQYTVNDIWYGLAPKLNWSTNIEPTESGLNDYELSADSKKFITDYIEDELIEDTILDTDNKLDTEEKLTVLSGTFKLYLH